MTDSLSDNELKRIARDLKRLGERRPGHDDEGMGMANWMQHCHAMFAMNVGMACPVQIASGLARPLHTVAWWRPGLRIGEPGRN